MATRHRHEPEQQEDDEEDLPTSHEDVSGSSGRRRRESGGDGARTLERPIPGIEVIRRAQRQLAEITGRMPDSVSGIGPTDGGWSMTVEMVELDRVPPSTSVLASYQVTLDRDGHVLEYQRTRRYYRNQADDQ